MIFNYVSESDHAYVECLPDGQMLASEADALDLVAACGEHLSERALVHAGCLPPEFYDLKTGLAGAVLQKLTNYRITAVFLISPERVGNGRFYEMMIEANRGRQFHFSPEREAAAAWLAS